MNKTKYTIAIASAIILVLFASACISQLFSWQIAARELSHVIAIQSMRNGTFQDVGIIFPENIYLYGPLKAYLLSLLPDYGIDLIVNRGASAICLLGACGFLCGAMRRIGSIAGQTAPWHIIIFLASLYLYTANKSFEMPNSLGLMLSNAVLFFSLRERRYNLILIPLLITACFCTKQYYLHSLVYVAAALGILRFSRKGILQLVVICLASALCIALLFMLPQTCYALQHHLNMRSDHSMHHLLQGTIKYACLMWPILACTVPVFVAQSVQYIKRRHEQPGFLHMDKLWLYFFCLFAIYGAVMLRMGQHTGAPGEYYYRQIFSPILFLFSAYIVRDTSRLCQFSTVATAIVTVLVYLPKNHWGSLNPSTFPPEASIIFNDFRNSQIKVRGSALIARIQYETMGRVDENGHLQYLDTIYSPQRNGADSMLRSAVEEYKQKLKSDIASGYYDVLYVDPCSFIDFYKEEINEHYTEEREFKIQDFPVIRYVKKENDSQKQASSRCQAQNSEAMPSDFPISTTGVYGAHALHNAKRDFYRNVVLPDVNPHYPFSYLVASAISHVLVLRRCCI